MTKTLPFFVLLFILGVALLFFRNPSPQNQLSPPAVTDNTPATENGKSSLEVIAKNLSVPWDIAFLPSGDIFFTERSGNVRIINPDRKMSPPIVALDDLVAQGEGGLLGIVSHPQWRSNGYIYLYYTYRNDGGNTLNRVVRYTFNGMVLENKKIVVDAIPGSSNHNGGRIKFGPDGFLYITTGDAQNPSLAQDTGSLAGKILRVTDEGKPAPDNPFANEVYSYGHRNPQGLAWDKDGQLWATEHGSSNFDEVNRIEKGKNYGWPKVKGSETELGLEIPFLHSGTSTWAPSGAVVVGDSLFFAGLRGAAIFKLNLKTKNLEKHFENQFGRIRTIALGPDSFFYILTSNRDGRGNPNTEDDRITKIHPSLFGVTLN